MQHPKRAFFGEIRGDRPSENYVSRLFQACFSRSTVFAQSILDVLWQRCERPGSTPRVEGWECDYQPATPLPGGGRPDLCILPPSSPVSRSGWDPIFVESKVESRLGEEQLARYLKYGVATLVVITKNRPEVSQQRLREIGVVPLRWQDICRALRQVGSRSQVGNFLCESFAEYLEECGMAYREDLTVGGLKEVRSLLSKIGKPSYLEMVPGQAFNVAHNCLGLLTDVKQMLLEEVPRLAAWDSWGPGYFHESWDDAGKMTHHAFGFDLFPRKGGASRRSRYESHHFCCRIYFPVASDGRIDWYFRETRAKKPDRQKSMPIEKVLSSGRLDAEKMAATLASAVRTWSVV